LIDFVDLIFIHFYIEFSLDICSDASTNRLLLLILHSILRNEYKALTLISYILILFTDEPRAVRAARSDHSMRLLSVRLIIDYLKFGMLMVFLKEKWVHEKGTSIRPPVGVVIETRSFTHGRALCGSFAIYNIKTIS
jgi:hypothetical protein